MFLFNMVLKANLIKSFVVWRVIFLVIRRNNIGIENYLLNRL